MDGRKKERKKEKEKDREEEIKRERERERKGGRDIKLFQRNSIATKIWSSILCPIRHYHLENVYKLRDPKLTKNKIQVYRK